MALTLSGSGITSANIVDGTIVDADVNNVAASKLTGDLPAIDGSNLTNLPGGGKVLQVVSSTYSTSTDKSGGYSDLGLSATITPSSTTSRVLVMFNIQYNLNSNIGFGVQLLRGTTNILTGTSHEIYVSGANIREKPNYIIDDSPNTTSATTYKVQVQTFNGTVRFCNDNNEIQMTLMEIGA